MGSFMYPLNKSFIHEAQGWETKMTCMEGFTQEIQARVTRYVARYYPKLVEAIDFSSANISINRDDIGAWTTEDVQTVVNVTLVIKNADDDKNTNININIPFEDVDFLLNDALTQALRLSPQK